MIRDLDWLRRLNRDNKGIWGIECPLGSSFDSGSLIRLSTSCETGVVHIVRDGERMKFVDSNQSVIEANLLKFVKHVSELAIEAGVQSVRIVVGDFNYATENEQCALMKTARSIQESITSLSCQFVFLGKWSFFAFRSAYRNIHGHTSSPPVDSKNIQHVPPWCANDVLVLLSNRRLVTANPSEIDLVACDFLVEQTAGDEFLIRRAVERVEEQGGKWSSSIEQVLSELVSAPDVIDDITQRINSLEVRAKVELTKLLRVHLLERSYESIDSEQLWLAGLVQRQKLEGGKQFVQIAGPLINTVIRRILESERAGSVVTPDCLCFEREAISMGAYRRIAQIENMLRNLIVAEWHTERGDKWSENLKCTKTSSRNFDDQEELIKLVMSLVQSELGIKPECSSLELATNQSDSSGRFNQTTILDSASDWQRRQRDNHAVELTNDNLMHFLTTESLVSVLVNKKNGLYGVGKPFKKEDLTAALGEYIVIRAAVAHNQPIKLSTISRLDDLQRKFIVWLTVFADQTIACDSSKFSMEDA